MTQTAKPPKPAKSARSAKSATATAATGSANRLPRLSTSLDRGREVSVGAFALTAILVLVIGIPVALAVFVGYPLPRSAPSADWLTTSVTAGLIIKVLACVVWALWAHFTVCVIAEWRALRSGRVPRDLPFGGSSQTFARRLVAAALLLAGAATAFGNIADGHSGGGTPSAPARHVASASQTPGVPTTRSTVTDAKHQAGAAGNAGHAAAQTEKGLKTFTVAPPNGRNHDCLWDIAERTLGNPMRYKEIFALNKDRIQADGGKLVDANLIRPGWQLRLPADASGPGVRAMPTPVSTPIKAAAAQADAATNAVAAQAGSASEAAGAVAPGLAALPIAQLGRQLATGYSVASPTSVKAPVAPSSAAQSGGSSLDSSLLGGGLMLAGLALALSARRGPYGAATDDELALTSAADTGLANSLDRALRNLAAARKGQGLVLPQPVLAWVSADEVSLALAGGDMTSPPAPWHATDDSTWACPLSESIDHPQLGETAAPFPGLLCVGRDADVEVFVDFEQAPGLISVGGDAERGRDLVTALAAQAVTCVWSDGAKATLVGFGDGEQLAGMDAHSLDHATSLGPVLDDLERRQADLARLQRSLGVDGVLNGRQTRRAGAWAPHVIVLSGSPTTEETLRLRQLVGDGRSQVVVLVVGDVTHAAWRFAIDAQNQLDLGVLGVTVRAHQLDRNSMLAFIDTLRAAGRDSAEENAAVSALAPRGALASTGGASGSADDAAAVRPDRPAANQAAVSVSLLGPVRVEAPGSLETDKRELATEIVIAVALAPAGIPEVVLRAAIWPRGVSDDIFIAAMRDSAAWLGHDSTGRAALREDDGRWMLGSSVWIDWEDLQLAARVATGANELESLQYGASLLRGKGFSGTPDKRYGWLSFHRCARDAAVVATAVVRRAAVLLTEDNRLGDAEQTLRHGLTLVPTAEPIWRDLLELVGRRGPAPAAAVADEMYDALRSARVWAQPETDALVSQLAPGRRGAESA